MSGKTEEGNFHIKVKEEIDKKAVTEGHFGALERRVSTIDSVLNDIINW